MLFCRQFGPSASEPPSAEVDGVLRFAWLLFIVNAANSNLRQITREIGSMQRNFSRCTVTHPKGLKANKRARLCSMLSVDVSEQTTYYLDLSTLNLRSR